ncbi:MAG TPA: hypothetical protein VK542_05555 [Gemmatimonadaceae bacterium]|nr:hypothetical protein [Gemmatimonadaceae bacterium]
MPRFVGMMFPVLALAMACSNSTGPSNLSFEGRSTVSPTLPMDVRTVVTVRNIGDKTTRISTILCGQPIRAYTTAERNGAWAWQSYDPTASACLSIARFVTLAPGDYYDFVETGSIPASLPSGVYYLAININGKLVAAGQFSK